MDYVKRDTYSRSASFIIRFLPLGCYINIYLAGGTLGFIEPSIAPLSSVLTQNSNKYYSKQITPEIIFNQSTTVEQIDHRGSRPPEEAVRFQDMCRGFGVSFLFSTLALTRRSMWLSNFFIGVRGRRVADHGYHQTLVHPSRST